MEMGRYNYSNNNPLNYNDPSGHLASEICMDDGKCKWEGDKKIIKTGGSGSNGGDRGGNDDKDIKSEKAMQGDQIGILDQLLPTHVGWRLQVEGCIEFVGGVCGSPGGNIAYNFRSHELAFWIDGAAGPSAGIGGGATVTTGPMIGWFMSSTKPLISGYSLSFNGTLANEGAISGSMNVPLAQHRGDNVFDTVLNGPYKDPYFGNIPLTFFLGGGAGGFYGGGGGSISGVIYGVSTDLSDLRR